MATLQHEALKAIAGGDQTGMFAFCELHGVYYHPMEPTYLTMGRIASWVLLMKNAEVTKLPGTKIPAGVPHVVDITLTGAGDGWKTREVAPMSEGGQV